MGNSASEMFVQCNICHLENFKGNGYLHNPVIHCIVNSVAPLVSNVWKWWRTTLYTANVTVSFFYACIYQLCCMFVNACCAWSASLK